MPPKVSPSASSSTSAAVLRPPPSAATSHDGVGALLGAKGRALPSLSKAWATNWRRCPCGGELKRVLSLETRLEPQEQRILFRGKKDNDECLHMAGVKDIAKVVLLEDPASKKRKLEQIKSDQGITKACEAIAVVRAEVSKLAEKVSALESAIHEGKKVAYKEFVVLTELLMVQFLKLHSIVRTEILAV
uniref:BAG family molecular chaperone regulator 4 n=1 Tax=Ananas comosus var. bracteatus TaxID=296719 RepID=A0A6V7QLV4_ANACO|nr:unnamed protein product [Ananas comosus var. bracteatus]